jgi:uncharacterized membrane protein YfcA
MTELLAYLGTGAVAGLLAGLLGIGGGLVIVPALAAMYSLRDFPDANLMHFAIGTSLATIVPTSIASLLSHHRRGGIHWQAVRGMTPGIVLGALGGRGWRGKSPAQGCACCSAFSSCWSRCSCWSADIPRRTIPCRERPASDWRVW